MRLDILAANRVHNSADPSSRKQIGNLLPEDTLTKRPLQPCESQQR